MEAGCVHTKIVIEFYYFDLHILFHLSEASKNNEETETLLETGLTKRNRGLRCNLGLEMPADAK